MANTQAIEDMTILHARIPAELAVRMNKWRHANMIESKQAAVIRLIELGLKFSKGLKDGAVNG